MTGRLITRDAAARHEAAHVAAMTTMGIHVRAVDLIPCGVRDGLTVHDHRVTDEVSAIKQAKHIMCAFIAEGANAIPAWPPDRGPVTSTDEKQIAHIADVLGWDKSQYRALIADSCELMATPQFKSAYRAVNTALERTDRLDEPTLRRLLAPQPERKVFRTQWRTPETFDQMGEDPA